MKKRISKIPKTNDLVKIMRMISREEQFERNGGAQFVTTVRKWKDKKKYNRKNEKRVNFNPSSFFLLY